VVEGGLAGVADTGRPMTPRAERLTVCSVGEGERMSGGTGTTGGDVAGQLIHGDTERGREQPHPVDSRRLRPAAALEVAQVGHVPLGSLRHADLREPRGLPDCPRPLADSPTVSPHALWLNKHPPKSQRP